MESSPDCSESCGQSGGSPGASEPRGLQVAFPEVAGGSQRHDVGLLGSSQAGAPERSRSPWTQLVWGLLKGAHGSSAPAAHTLLFPSWKCMLWPRSGGGVGESPRPAAGGMALRPPGQGQAREKWVAVAMSGPRGYWQASGPDWEEARSAAACQGRLCGLSRGGRPIE